jgi:hypothetical protein
VRFPAQAHERSANVGVDHTARRETETLERTRSFRWLVRAGFIARAVTYGLIGVLALAIAFGAGTMGAAPNQQGALSLISQSAVGRPALVAICAGLLAYGLWKLTQGIFGRGPEGGGGTSVKDRVSNLAGGLVYLGFFAVAVRVLTGSAGNSSGAPQHAASGILAWPGGQVLVGGVGAALMAISLYQLYDAARGGFADEAKIERMSPRGQRAFMLLGRIGLGARALVFGLIGYFLLRTAIEFNPNNAIGVDGAVARLHHQALGSWLVGLVGLGLIVFAVFSLLEGRYRRL